MVVDDKPVAAAGSDTDSAEASRRESRRRQPNGLILAVGSKALAIAVARVGLGLIIERVAVGIYGVRPFPPSPTAVPQHVSLVSGFFRWDALLYQGIVQHGYSTNSPTLTSFFPLYPYTVRAVSDVTSLGYRSAALAVSWVALWSAIWGVMRLASVVFPESDSAAWRSGLLLAFFPTSVFLISGYAESTFVALGAWTLVALAERRVWIAAVLAGLASGTRPEGLFLALAVVIWTLREEWPLHRAQVPRVLVQLGSQLALSLSGLVAFSAFLWNRFGTPLEYVRVQKSWNRHLSWPFHPLTWSLKQVLEGRIVGAGSANVILMTLINDGILLLALAGLASLVIATRGSTSPWWLWAPAVVTLTLVASNGPFGQSPEGAARLIMCIAPLYALVARARSEVTWAFSLVASGMLAAVVQAVFNTGGWVT